MEMHQLRYFVAVAEAGNFTRAAEQSGVAQPSLSLQIAKLERDVGQKLFHRLGRRAVLTEAGGALLDHARRALFELDEAGRELRDGTQLARRIVVGAIPTLAPLCFPPLLARCRAAHPQLEVHTREEFRGHLLRAVLDGELDLALYPLPVQEPHLAVEPLFTEPLLLVVARTHRLAERATVRAADLAQETFILLGDGSSLTLQLQRFLGATTFEPRIGGRCAQVATVKALVAAGAGVAILPAAVREPADEARLVYRSLLGPARTREIGVVRHALRYQSRGAEQFLAVLRAWVRESAPAVTPSPAPRGGAR